MRAWFVFLLIASNVCAFLDESNEVFEEQQRDFNEYVTSLVLVVNTEQSLQLEAKLAAHEILFLEDSFNVIQELSIAPDGLIKIIIPCVNMQALLNLNVLLYTNTWQYFFVYDHTTGVSLFTFFAQLVRKPGTIIRF